MDPTPLKMIILVDISTEESKNTAIKKKTSSEKVNTLKREYSFNNLLEIVSVAEKTEPKSIRKKNELGNTTGKEQDVEPHVESPDDQHVKPNEVTYVPTSSDHMLNTLLIKLWMFLYLMSFSIKYWI